MFCKKIKKKVTPEVVQYESPGGAGNNDGGAVIVRDYYSDVNKKAHAQGSAIWGVLLIKIEPRHIA